MQAWQMREAEARLSEVIKCAESEGPQNITLHGQIVAVLISKNMFERLTGNEHSLVDFMRKSPLYGLHEISLGRDASLTRELSQANDIDPPEIPRLIQAYLHPDRHP